MNQIKFEKITIEGFRSIVKPLMFNLDRSGLNLVKGANGTGKTTVFEALIWCLYGVNLKDTTQDMVSSWPETRPAIWKGTRVMVDLKVNGDHYCIVRHLSYNGESYGLKGGDTLMVWKGNDEHGEKSTQLGSERNKAELQETINELLGMEVKTFMNSILFGQRIAKLIEQDNTDKRKLFEQLFDVEWVNLAKAKCDSIITVIASDISKKEQEVIHNETLIQEKINKLNSIKLMLAGWDTVRQDRLQAKQQYLEQKTKEITSYEHEVRLLTKAIKDVQYDPVADEKLSHQFKDIDYEIKKVQTEASNRDRELFLLNHRVQDYEKDVKKIQADIEILQKKKIEDTCPYCEQDLKPGNKLERNHQSDIQHKKDELKKQENLYKQAKKELETVQNTLLKSTPIDKLSKEKLELEKQIAAMDDKYEQVNRLEKKLNANEAYISQLKNEIKHITEEVERIKKETPPPNNIPQIENEIEEIKTDLLCLEEALYNRQEEREKAEWWSKKAFGAGGIKSFVFKAMLTQLNQNTRKYGNRLGVSMEFSIDLSKASKPFITRCSLGDKLNKDYREFSGGQKQRLDIVLLFAMHDLISAGNNINILIMDEVLEGLDEEGETAVFDLIRTKADEGRSVYVISHSAVLDSLYANTIQIENVNGNTTVS